MDNCLRLSRLLVILEQSPPLSLSSQAPCTAEHCPQRTGLPAPPEGPACTGHVRGALLLLDDRRPPAAPRVRPPLQVAARSLWR